jgi:ParB-like chromosome segregation protein Spo0J
MEILSINQWALSHLQNHKRSFRCTDNAVKRMMESIRVYGLRIPLLVKRAGEIIDHQLRAKAAREADGQLCSASRKQAQLQAAEQEVSSAAA